LVGRNYSGTISNSYATGSVSSSASHYSSTSHSYAGGLVGENSGAISNSYATGSVSSSASSSIAGGLVSFNSGPISNCYATGSVSSSAASSASSFSIAGGLAGTNAKPISNCYATGSVSSSSDDSGGLVAHNSGLISDSYWNKDTTGQSGSAGSSASCGLTTAELCAKNFSLEWNFYIHRECPSSIEYPWFDLGDNFYPQFYWQVSLPTVLADYDSSSSSFLIHSSDELRYLSEHADLWQSDFSLAADIDASVTSDWNEGLGFFIGTQAKPFSGSFDGNGYKIVGLAVNNSKAYSEYLGLFGVVATEGNVENVVLENAKVVGTVSIATLDELRYVSEHADLWQSDFKLTADIDASASSGWNDGLGFSPIGNQEQPFSGSFEGNGYMITGLTVNNPTADYMGLFGLVAPNGEVKNVELENATITGRDHVGRLIGDNSGSIDNCSTSGNAVGRDGVGGLIGDNSGSIDNCSTSGNIIGRDDVGGLIGFLEGSLDNSRSSAEVSGEDCIGGLVGTASGSVISRCSSSSVVSGQDSVAGFVGFNCFGALIQESFATGSSQGEYEIGGLVGLNWESNIKASYADCTVTGEYDVGGLVGYSGGYPALIKNCYAKGNIIGIERVGGLLGAQWDDTETNGIQNSYAFNTVTGIIDVGAVTGWGDPQNCYYYSETSLDYYYSGSSTEALTLRKMLKGNFAQVSMAGVAPNGAYWDFGATPDAPWVNSGDWSAPSFYWQSVTTSPYLIEVTDQSLLGEGWFDEVLDITEYGFELSTDPAFADAVKHAGTSNKDGVFEILISNLTADTVYYFRTYAQNASETYHGDTESFKTLGGSSLIDLLEDDDNARNSFHKFLLEKKITSVDPIKLADYQDEFLRNIDYLTDDYYYQTIVDAVNNDESVVISRVHQGWNLVSSPFKKWQASTIFDDDVVATMYGFDPQSGQYYYLTSLSILEPGRGYWIYIHASLLSGKSYLEYVMTGLFKTGDYPEVESGWNLIGPIKESSESWGEAYQVYQWNAERQIYEVSTGDSLKLGRGYWLYSSQTMPEHP
jgi:hypothetical protein